MHYHCEVVMPPRDDVKEALDEILDPFQEGQKWYRGFWDWWQIGGRYSGSKITKALPQEARDAFFAELEARNVTVSGIQLGKQTLQPAAQGPMVDALWREHFPDTPFEHCPLFDHAGKQLPGDIMRLDEVRGDFPLEHLIVAGLHGWHDKYQEEVEFEAKFMLRDTVWNGCNHEKTVWDRTFRGGMAMWAEDLEKHYSDAAQEHYTPQEDWLVVTVDYHS